MAAKQQGKLNQIKDEPFRPNPKHLDGVPDLCMLQYLGEDNVLHNLNVRYQKKAIYTSVTAKVLIAVNPYMKMEGAYSEEIMAQYQAAPANLEGLLSEGDLSPHVYTVAHAAYNNLVHRKKNQSVIVCGESGSGKTESAKIFMRFLAFTSTSTSANPQEFKEAESIGKQVLDANPILETFGNAKTVLNNNSSRFGKFTKMLFNPVADDDKRRQLVGAQIETYLLEKSRVVRQDPGERNYHVFYQLCQNAAKLPELKLGAPEQFHYLAQSGVVTIDGDTSEDIRSFDLLISAFNTLLIPVEQQMETFRIVAGILHMGNTKFKEAGQGCEVANADILEHLAFLFGVEKPQLETRFKTKNVNVPGQGTIVSKLDVTQASFNRDSMAKGLYNGLFRWVVNRINQQSTRPEAEQTLWIGTLDVFGFEIFENNSFEQFCINFANERLQQYFNHHVLKAEQDLYRQEALLWDPIDLPDNQDVIDLVMGKPYGILAILDSTCVQPKGDDKAFSGNLFQQHPWHPRLKKTDKIPQKPGKAGSKPGQFDTINGMTIKHYAGEVLYDNRDFLVKNADSSTPETIELFMSSKSHITQVILTLNAQGEVDQDAVKKVKNKAFRSTGTVFSNQLQNLMETLDKTTPFFVRCIKPNRVQKPNNFEPEYVRPQLRCGGLVEALRIIKCGFPTRASYVRIHQMFGSILKGYKTPSEATLNKRDFAQALILKCGGTEVLGKTDYQLGLTMVFFRPGKQSYLQAILDRSPADISKAKIEEIRKFLVYKRIVRMRGCIRAFLRTVHFLARRRFQHAGEVMMYLGRSMGNALIRARATLNEKKFKAEQEARMRDQKFQDALRAEADLKVLQKHKQELDAQLTDWQKREEQTRKQLADQEAFAKTMQAKVQDLTQKYLDAQKGYEKEQKLTAQQKTQLDDLMQNLQKEGKTGAAAIAKIAQMEADLASARANAERNEASIKRAEEAHQQGQKEWGRKQEQMEQDLRQEREALQDLKNQHMLTQKTWESKGQNLEQTLTNRTDEITQLKRDLSALTDKLELSKQSSDKQVASLQQDLERERAAARERGDKQGADIREKESQLSELKNQFNNIKNDLQRAKEQHDDLTRQHSDKVATSDREKSDRDNLIAELRAEIKKLKEQLEEVRRQKEELERQLNEQLRKERGEARDKETRLEGTLREKELELGRVRNEFELYKQQAEARLKSADESLKDTKGESSEARARLEKLIQDRDAQLMQAKSDLAMQKAEHEAHKVSAAETARSLGEQANSHKDKTREVEEKYERQLRKMEQAHSDLKSELTQAAAAAEQHRNAAASVGQSHNDLRDKHDKTVQDFTQQLEELRRDKAALQAQLDALRRQAEEKARGDTQKLNDAKGEQREAQDKYERLLMDKDNQIAQIRHELASANDRYENTKSRGEQDQKGLSEQFRLEQESNARKQAKFDQDMAERNATINELKNDLRAEKRNAQQAQEKMQQTMQDKDKELDQLRIENKTHKATGDSSLQNALSQVRELNDSLKRKENEFSKVKEDYTSRERELEAEIKSLREQLLAARSKSDSEVNVHRDNHARVSQQLAEKNAMLAALQKEYSSHRAQSQSEGLLQQTALQGQLQMLQALNHDLKNDKDASRLREDKYRNDLREAMGRLGHLETELRATKTGHDGDLDRARSDFQNNNLKWQMEEKHWREEILALQTKLMAKEAESGELKSQIQGYLDKEHSLRESLRSQQMGVSTQVRDLTQQVNEMKVERVQWVDQKAKYERDFQTMAHSLQDVKNSLQQSQLKYSAEKEKLSTEVRALTATLEQERAAWRVKETSLTEEIKNKSSSNENDNANLRKQLETVQVQAKAHMEAQAQAFKYRLQYLEMNQRNFHEEKKKWQDKEHLYEEKLNEMAYQINEIKHEHSQAVNVHLAYKSHVEAKLKSREAQDAIWQMKIDGLKSQAQVEKVNLDGQLKGLQNQLEMANRRYQKAEQDVAGLRDQLAQAQAQASHFSHDPYGLQSPGFNASMGLATPKSFMGGFGTLKPMTPLGGANGYGIPSSSSSYGAPPLSATGMMSAEQQKLFALQSGVPAYDIVPQTVSQPSMVTPRASFAPKSPLTMNGGFAPASTSAAFSSPVAHATSLNGVNTSPALSVNVDSSSPRHSIHAEPLPEQPFSGGATVSSPVPAPATATRQHFSPVPSPRFEAPGDRLVYSDQPVAGEQAVVGGDVAGDVQYTNGLTNGTYSPEGSGNGDVAPLSPSHAQPVAVTES